MIAAIGYHRGMEAITFVAAHPDGERLAVATEHGWLAVWVPRTNAVVAHHALGAYINKVAWTAGGDHLIATAGDALIVLSGDGATRQRVIETGHANLVSFAVHPSRPLAATTGQTPAVRLWDVATGAAAGELLVKAGAKSGGGTAVALTEAAVVAGYRSGFFAACDYAGEELAFGEIAHGYVGGLGASADGGVLVAGGSRGRMVMIDARGADWKAGTTWDHPPRPISTNTIQFAPDGRFVAAHSDDTATLYQSVGDTVGTTLGRPFYFDRKPWARDFIVSAACFVPGTPLVATAHFTGRLVLWNRPEFRDAAITFDVAAATAQWVDADDPAAAYAALIK